MNNMKKWIKVEAHGSAYTMEKGELIVAPLNTNDTIDEGSWAVVEQAPKKFSKGHQTALMKLGVPKAIQKRILQKIHYY